METRTSRRLGACLLISLSAALLAASARAQVTLHDDRGAALRFGVPPQRIVSLLPSLTESVCALGACARLVGTDRFSNWPASVVALPKLGGIDDTQIERIVALRPDVVLMAPGSRAIDRFEALGLNVLVLQTRDRGDVRRALSVLARMLGMPARAEQVWAGIERDTLAAAERVPAVLRGKRVYFEIDTAPYAASAASFIGQTLARLGMSNAVPAELGPFPKLNPEHLVRMQPDIVMAVRAGLADMSERPGWAALRALQERRTCGFDSARYELLVRPGPRMGEAAAVLADCLVSIAAQARGP